MNDLKGIIEDCNKSDLVSDKVIKKIIEIIGQEEWQIIHDENSDICTTMGELIITLKEVAELKHTIATLRQEKDNVSMHAKAMEVVAKTRSEQLTKAKDHIKRLLDCLRQDTNDPQTNYYVVQYMTEAEQFLKDSEVEK